MSALRYFRRHSSFLSPRSALDSPMQGVDTSDKRWHKDLRDELKVALRETLCKEFAVASTQLEQGLRQELREFLHGNSGKEMLPQPATSAATDVPKKNSRVAEADETLQWVTRRNSWAAYEDSQWEVSTPNDSPTSKRVSRRSNGSPPSTQHERGSSGYQPLYAESLQGDAIGDHSLDHQTPDTPPTFRRTRRGSKTEMLCGIQRHFQHASLLDEDRGNDEQMGSIGVRSCLRALVHSVHFDVFFSLLILINAIVIGLEVDYMARQLTDEPPGIFRMMENVFCGIFFVEVLLRNIFECTPGFWWNLFDCAVVSVQMTEAIMELIRHVDNSFSQKADILRIIRVFRSIRIFRSLRVFHLLGGLRMLVVSIYDSFRSLAWTLVLLLLMLYVFAVYLTQVVTDWTIANSDSSQGADSLTHFYGTVDRSLLSLYKTVSDGIHWDQVSDPLIQYCSPWFVVLFVIHIGFMLFAVMNVVTGVFVELAIRKAGDDEKRVLTRQMKELFGDGRPIMWEDFQRTLETPSMQLYFSAIDLDPQDAYQLFNLLDIEETGAIDTDDLVSSCLRLHGSAKAIELAAFISEYRRRTQQWKTHALFVEKSLAKISEAVSEILTRGATEPSDFASRLDAE